MKKFFLLIPFLFLPAMVFAEYIPFSYCLPKEQPAKVNDGTIHTCYLCAKDGMPEFPISWDLGTLTPSSKDLPYCIASISRPGKHIIIGGYRDNDGYATSSSKFVSNRLKSQDSVLLRSEDLKVGDEVSVSCLGQEGSRASNKFVFHGCPPDCEVGFDAIQLNLDTNNLTLISEKNAMSWGEAQNEDFCFFKNYNCTLNFKGSGDGRDLKDLITLLHIERNDQYYYYNLDARSLFAASFFSTLKVFEENGDILPIIIVGKMFGHPSYAEGEVASHALIAVSAKDNLPDNRVEVSVIDPNAPLELTTINCIKEDNTAGQVLLKCGKFMFGSAYMDENELIPAYIPYAKGGYITWGELLKKKHDDICSKNPSINLCKGKVIDRWSEWGLAVVNSPDPGFYGREKGFCGSWVIQQSKIAYLGNFSSVDYHPGDGNKVGIHCDENRQPISNPIAPIAQFFKTKYSQNISRSFLANLWSAWQGLIEFRR